MLTRRTLLAALPIATLAACTPEPEPEMDGSKRLLEGPRTDVEPLLEEWPALDKPVSALWYTGAMGEEGRAPGPTDYWIDAVVTVTPETMERLRSLGDQEPADATVWRDLVPDLPTSLTTSDELVAEFQQFSYSTGAWLSVDTDQVVLTQVTS